MRKTAFRHGIRGSSSLCGRRRFAPPAHSSAQMSRAAHMRCIVLSQFIFPRAHSHTTIRFHPSLRQVSSLRMSLRTFLDHFSIQNATLLFGIVESAQPCLCQKQPRTSIIVRARGTTISGCPTNRLSHTRNLQPAANMRRRTSVSGFVSRPRMRLIILLRCSGVILSIADSGAGICDQCVNIIAGKLPGTGGKAGKLHHEQQLCHLCSQAFDKAYAG